MARELDEDDVRIRPGRGSRPRSKHRPTHDDAVSAVVTTVDRGRYTCELADGRQLSAVRARALGRRGVIVGDRVGLTGDLSGTDGTLARIVVQHPRTTVLLRTAEEGAAERPLVANADQLAVVLAAADPQPRRGFVDRCLVAAYDARLEPLLIVTKTDLADPTPFLASYAELDVPVVRIGPTSNLDPLRQRLAGLTTVLIGHSGVGKSTLVNRLVPAAQRATGQVNVVTGRGRHTSTSALMMDLPGGGHIVDTPGVRSFGLQHVTADTVLGAFEDLAEGVADCPRGCTHDEPDCALDAFCAQGGAPPERLASLRRILASLQETDESGL